MRCGAVRCWMVRNVGRLVASRHPVCRRRRHRSASGRCLPSMERRNACRCLTHRHAYAPRQGLLQPRAQRIPRGQSIMRTGLSCTPLYAASECCTHRTVVPSARALALSRRSPNGVNQVERAHRALTVPRRRPTPPDLEMANGPQPIGGGGKHMDTRGGRGAFGRDRRERQGFAPPASAGPAAGGARAVVGVLSVAVRP